MERTGYGLGTSNNRRSNCCTVGPTVGGFRNGRNDPALVELRKQLKRLLTADGARVRNGGTFVTNETLVHARPRMT